jgi:hypothetical protein
MNNILKSALSIKCPTCGAEAGIRCSLERLKKDKLGGYAHPLRVVMMPITPIFVFNREEKKQQAGHISIRCSHGSHKICKGKVNLNHGVKSLCNCYCHKGEIKCQQENIRERNQ